MTLTPRVGFWTHDDEAVKDVGHLYYFAPSNRTPPPYRRQRHVNAIIDIASDGTLAGVELIDDMPPPPTTAHNPSPDSKLEAYRKALEPFARIGLTTDCPETNLAGVESLDMPDFCITPAQVKAARKLIAAGA